MINTDLILWFNSGVGIGFVILTTLLLFPGVEHKGLIKKKDQNSTDGDARDDRKTRKTIETSLSSSTEDNVDEGQYAFTPYQKMNFAVYIILFVVAGLILDREYEGMFCIWLRFYFPREAAILGFAPLVERQPR